MKLFIKNQKELDTYLELAHALHRYSDLDPQHISKCEYRLVVLDPEDDTEAGDSLDKCGIPLPATQAKHVIRKMYWELSVKTLGALFEIFVFDNIGLYETLANSAQRNSSNASGGGTSHE